MKAPAFDYARPETLADALALLARHGDGAKIVAGGQSLLPALNLRLQQPGILIDIGRIEALRGIAVADGHVRIGATTRHVDLLRSPELAEHAALIGRAIAHVAHPAIRNRGTIGGNLAQGDPASELPACAVALRATIVVEGQGGERQIAAEDFFLGVYETALAEDEILTAIEIPRAEADTRCSFGELARRAGDYAIAGLAATARLDGRVVTEFRPVFFSIGSRPTLAAAAADRIVGRAPTPDVVADAQAALAHDLEPQDDLQASAATRLHLARVLLARALAEIAPAAMAGTVEPERLRA